MKELSAVKLTVKRSRFFAHLYSLDSPSEADTILKIHRKEYKKACHHCYAVRFLDGDDVAISKDDGEVGHPGRVLMELLEKYDLNKHALVVSRIFGGVKLGVGGVSKAFREAGENAVAEYFDRMKR
jgi:putative IMPACT (imprinted ancient) family translation regulator